MPCCKLYCLTKHYMKMIKNHFLAEWYQINSLNRAELHRQKVETRHVFSSSTLGKDGKKPNELLP